jgi:hypothetical protein
MTYSVPELLLVGTAQNLVLGPGLSADPVCKFDPIAHNNSTRCDLEELW